MIGMNDFLIFSKRLKLAEKINSYIAENGIAMDAFGVITTLSSLGLLDGGACKKYLDSGSETVTDTDKRIDELQERLLNGEGSTEEIQEYLRLTNESYLDINKPLVRICVKCGKDFITRYRVAKRCPECQEKEVNHD